MLHLGIIETSAEKRTALHSYVTELLQSQIPNLDLLPKVSLKSYSGDEVQYNSEPDLCIIGHDLLFKKTALLRKIRQRWASSAFIVELDSYASSIPVLESLSRLGLDDTFTRDTTPAEFLSKILILSQKQRGKKTGRMILVDSGKGGLGQTSVAAALGEVLAYQKYKVLLIDLDFETQDLSRFLLARPYVNENLAELLRGKLAFTQESLTECFQAIWQDGNLACMSPCSLDNLPSTWVKHLASALEIADEIFDFLVVDLASCSQGLAKDLYRLCDQVVFVTSNDPAALYPSVHKLQCLSAFLPVDLDPLLLESQTHSRGISSKLLRSEINKSLMLSKHNWLKAPIRFSAKACHWPGSGYSMYTLAGYQIKKTFKALAAHVISSNTKEKLVQEKQNQKLLPFLWNKEKVNTTSFVSNLQFT